MSLYECIKCWEYPCTCGYEYKKRYNNPEEMVIFLVFWVIDHKRKLTKLYKY